MKIRVLSNSEEIEAKPTRPKAFTCLSETLGSNGKTSVRQGIIAITLSLMASIFACSQAAPVERANAVYDSGEQERGIAILADAVEKEPSNARLQFEYGKLLMRNKKASLATWPLIRAAGSSEYREPATMLASRALMEGRNYGDAERLLSELLDENPDLEPALLLRSQARLKGHLEEQALEDFSRILELRPGDFVIQQARLEALLRLERSDEARIRLKEMQDFILEGENIPAGVPPRICTLDAVFTAEMNQIDEARKIFDDCLAAFPDSLLLLREMVKFYDQLGETKHGTQLVEEAIERANDSSDLTFILAKRYQSMGALTDAERVLKEGTQKTQSVRLWAELSQHYVETDRLEEAREAMEKTFLVRQSQTSSAGDAEAGHPQTVQLESQTQESLFRMGDILVLLKDEEKLAKIMPLLEEPSYRHFLAGRMKIEQGKDREALAEYEKGFRYWPANPGARYLAARAAARMGDFTEAILHYREAVRSDPGKTPASFELAKLQAAMGRFGAATQPLQVYIETTPDDVEALRVWARYAVLAGRLAIAARARQMITEVPGQAAVAISDHALDLRQIQGPQEATEYILESVPHLELSENREALGTWTLLESEQGRGDKALARVESIRSNLEQPDAALERIRGGLLARNDRPREAIEAYILAQKIDPRQWRAFAEAARLAALSGDKAQAIEWYDSAAQNSPDPEIQSYEAAELMLSYGKGTQQYQDGLERMRTVLHDYPFHGQSAYRLAAAAMAQGKTGEDVLALAERAALFHATPDVVELLGRLHLARQEYSHAVEALRWSIDQNPSQSAKAHAALGHALLGLNNQAEARASFQRALSTGGLENEAEIRAQLTQLTDSAESS